MKMLFASSKVPLLCNSCLSPQRSLIKFGILSVNISEPKSLPPYKLYRLTTATSNHFQFYNVARENLSFCQFFFFILTVLFCIAFRCMVHGYAFYIAVVVPVAAILFANTVTLTKVTYNLYRHGKKKARNLSDSAVKKNPIIGTTLIISQARIAFTCNVLLGITWIFALLAVGKATVYFQWLFCIFNSLQGFFIFVFYTLRNQDVKKAWVKRGKRSIQESSSRTRFEDTLSRGKWCIIAISNLTEPKILKFSNNFWSFSVTTKRVIKKLKFFCIKVSETYQLHFIVCLYYLD